MNKDSFIQSCDDIYEKIKSLGESVVIDGVIDIDFYLKSPIKVMWILKETNSGGNWSIIDNYKNHKWLTDCNVLMSIRRVIYTSYGIMHPEVENWSDFPWSSEEECQLALRNIAFVNINKMPGGSFAYDDAIQNAYNNNRELLKLQFDTYDPDVIIFGNTLKYVSAEDFGIDFNEIKKERTEKIDTHYYRCKDKLFINAWHPSYYRGITDKDYVMDIVEIVRKWDNERNRTSYINAVKQSITTNQFYQRDR